MIRSYRWMEMPGLLFFFLRVWFTLIVSLDERDGVKEEEKERRKER